MARLLARVTRQTLSHPAGSRVKIVNSTKSTHTVAQQTCRSRRRSDAQPHRGRCKSRPEPVSQGGMPNTPPVTGGQEEPSHRKISAPLSHAGALSHAQDHRALTRGQSVYGGIVASKVHHCKFYYVIIIIYHALINALSSHMIHINLNTIFYSHVEHSPTKTICIKYYMEIQNIVWKH